jgi:hypothetical protein
MAKRCPPGVLCIENVTIMFICVILLIVGAGVYLCRDRMQGARQMQGASHMHNSAELRPSVSNNIILERQRKEEKGVGNDVFFDLYKEPVRDDRCITRSGDVRGAIPINVSTQGCGDAKYRQVGILTRYGGKDETILPLMGRPLFPNRDKWNFYTMNDKNNMIKLPVKVKGRSGTSEVGCDNVYTGDLVFVEGYNEAFKVTTYENDVIRYLPSL